MGENDGKSLCQIERFSFRGIVDCSICVVHSKREFVYTIMWINVARYLAVSLECPVRTFQRGRQPEFSKMTTLSVSDGIIGNPVLLTKKQSGSEGIEHIPILTYPRLLSEFSI